MLKRSKGLLLTSLMRKQPFRLRPKTGHPAGSREGQGRVEFRRPIMVCRRACDIILPSGRRKVEYPILASLGLRPFPAEPMRVYPIRPPIGNVRNDDAALIEPARRGARLKTTRPASRRASEIVFTSATAICAVCRLGAELLFVCRSPANSRRDQNLPPNGAQPNQSNESKNESIPLEFHYNYINF